jgi:hypothetical protein
MKKSFTLSLGSITKDMNLVINALAGTCSPKFSRKKVWKVAQLVMEPTIKLKYQVEALFFKIWGNSWHMYVLVLNV